MKKVIRLSTVPLSLNVLLKGQLSFLNKYYHVIAVSGAGKDLDAVKTREKVETEVVEMQRQISPIKDVISLIKLYFYFKKEKPFIVHSITPKAGLLSLLASKAAGVPIRIHTFTGLIFPSRKGFMQQVLIGMDKLLCSCATNIYPEGKGVKKDLLKYKITRKPLKVLANGNINGIDTTHFSPSQIPTAQQEALRKKLDIKESNFVFIFVGRLVGDKGINELVAAFEQICQPAPRNSHPSNHNPNLESRNPEPESIPSPHRPIAPSPRLLLVGPLETNLDPLKPETLREIETNPHIITTGYQDDVRPYFAISNALAFPSYREGFPNVVMQAGAMGLPSIVTDINGCNEIIIEGKNGTIVPPKNVQALTKAMQRMLEDNQWREQLQQNAREMIVSRYEQKMVWAALLEEYEHLVKQIQDPEINSG